MTETLDSLVGDDRIDSRDFEERLHELEGMVIDGEVLDEGEADELIRLKVICNDLESVIYEQETLIRDSDFEDYARELADDIGAINSDAGWPNSCIDWEQAARELCMDYTAYEIEGIDYWARS